MRKMKLEKQRHIDQLILKLSEVHQEVIRMGDLEMMEKLQHAIHPNYRYSATNLLRYLKLRSFDLQEIQLLLTNLGLSSLSHAERHVLANIENLLYLLHAQRGSTFYGKYPFGEHPVTYAQSAQKLQENTRRLFGEHFDGPGIMVTLPTMAADPSYVKMLLQNGMEVARINCSHDDETIWIQMVENVRSVSKAIGRPCTVYIDLSGPKIRTVELYPAKGVKSKRKYMMVHEGDELFLVKDHEVMRIYGEKEVSVVTCNIPFIIDDLSFGHHIWFDDGKIGGVIEEKVKGGVRVKILQAAPEGVKLKKEKGINLPDTALNLPSLTANDIDHLDFICEYGDIVGYSFVRTVEDVAKLQDELARRGREDLGMVLKIENREAFANLPALILKAMENPTIGIMAARGDLAVELGPERLSEVQEQIMWICEAAMVPSIWATQVLESLAKKGVASRPEITDAAMSVRAECVMLNKGPYIHKALQTLNNILFRMEQHQYKKQSALGKLKVAEAFWRSNLVL
jgi:pyruvate kinase